MDNLTDLASVRQFMQKRASDTMQDADLEVLIEQVTEAITRECDREFSPVAGETRSFEYLPSGEECDIVNLAPYELRALSVATLDPGEASPIILTPTQYRLRPYPARDGTFFSVRLVSVPQPLDGCGLPFVTRRLDLLGDWGLPSVPGEIKHWANVTVESWVHLRRDPGLGPGASVEIDGPTLRAEDIPMAVRHALRRWRRPEALV